jgi:hypothetical protein
MEKRIQWCRLAYAIFVSLVSCWFVTEYSQVSLSAYKMLHQNIGPLTVWCEFLHSYSRWFMAVPVLGGIVGCVAIIKENEMLLCLTVSLVKLFSYFLVLVTLIAWSALATPRISLRGIMW